MFFALIRSVLFEKRIHVNQSTTTSSAILTQKKRLLPPLLSSNLSQNTSFSIHFGYDSRSVLKHVLKSYDNFFDVHNSRKRVVGLIYTKQFMSWPVVNLPHATKSYRVNRP